MVVVPLGVAGVAYGIAYDGVGLSAFWATALGWFAGLVAVCRQPLLVLSSRIKVQLELELTRFG